MNTERSNGGDSAALSVAVIAGAIAVFMTPGPYNFLTGVLGLTRFFLVWAYAHGRERTRLQSLAFASVVSFALSLLVGLIAEVIYGRGLPSGTYDNLKGNISAVPDWLIAIAWVVFTVIVCSYDRRTAANKASKQNGQDSAG